jgi:hypothetical protein
MIKEKAKNKNRTLNNQVIKNLSYLYTIFQDIMIESERERERRRKYSINKIKTPIVLSQM